MNLISRINIFSETLDGENLKISKDIVSSLEKVSQYVGTQGNWIANSRCWGNCYRQKRSKSPSKMAQEIWEECKSEFQDYVNDKNESWMKYADSKDIIKTSNIYLNNSINEKMSNGIDVGTAVFSSIDNIKNSISESYMSSAIEMSKIAINLDDDSKINEATDIVTELIKEAGWWDNVKNFGNNIKNMVQNGGGWEGGKALTQIQNIINGLKSSYNEYNKNRKAEQDSFNNFKKLRDDGFAICQNLSQSNNPTAQAFAKQTLPIFQNIINDWNNIPENLSALENIFSKQNANQPSNTQQPPTQPQAVQPQQPPAQPQVVQPQQPPTQPQAVQPQQPPTQPQAVQPQQAVQPYRLRPSTKMKPLSTGASTIFKLI